MQVIPGAIKMLRSRQQKSFQTDNEKWEAYVAPILGKTDMIIFAFGADIGDWQDILWIIRSLPTIRAEDTITTVM